jgi:hypothetical protein
MSWAPASRRKHQNLKSTAVMDYNKYEFGINYPTSLTKCWAILTAVKIDELMKEIFFHLFDVCGKCPHIVCANKTNSVALSPQANCTD